MKKKRKEKIRYYGYFTDFTYHKSCLSNVSPKQLHLINGASRGAEVKKATSLVIFLIH
jgi:hypothetical protein